VKIEKLKLEAIKIREERKRIQVKEEDMNNEV
jgi:hypothetical protein